MPLSEIDLPIDLGCDMPADLQRWLDGVSLRIQSFQDRWDRKPIEQFVASDYELVYQTLRWISGQKQLVAGRLFCEWGCGFGVISCLAAQLGWDAVGIEAEAELYAQAERTVQQSGTEVELHHGNFLPPGSETLSGDPTLPSLGHAESCVYEKLGLSIHDFHLIFAYPWPGEGEFLEAVFERYAEPGACLLTFVGPYDLRLVRKAVR